MNASSARGGDRTTSADAPPQTAVDLRGVGKRYGRHWALQECTLGLPSGRMIALVGPNGAGKSTLLQLLVGLLRPTRGHVSVLGFDPRVEPFAALPRIGYVAQDQPLYQRFTVGEMLHAGRSLNPRWDQAFAEGRLARLGVPAHQQIRKLSGGQHAQVALTLALAKMPALLILDEPVAGLDPLARQEFLLELRSEVAARGVTALLSSHVLSDLEASCEHIVILSGGRVILVGAVPDLLTEHRVVIGQPGATATFAATARPLTTQAAQPAYLVRWPIDVPHGWRTEVASLEALVLAYLRTPATESAPKGDDR